MGSERRVSRRAFLGRSAGIFVGLAARRSVANESVAIGIVGCGSRGMVLLEALRRRADVRIAAVCDAYMPRAQRARAHTGAAMHPRWMDLAVSADIDAVVIATPDHLHAAVAVAAMESGKDVYCEYPMSRTIAQAGAFRDSARRTGRVVQIGVPDLADGAWAAAREAVRTGVLGQLVWAQPGSRRPAPCTARPAGEISPADLDWDGFTGAAPKRSFDPDRYIHWRRYRDYSLGAATAEFYAALTPLLLACDAPMPVRAAAAGGRYDGTQGENPDCLVMTFEYAGGFTIAATTAAHGQRTYPAVIRGERGAIECGDGVLKVRDAAVVVGKSECRTLFQARSRSCSLDAALLADWLDRIRDRGRCLCDEEAAYRAQAAISLGMASFREGRSIGWADLRDGRCPAFLGS